MIDECDECCGPTDGRPDNLCPDCRAELVAAPDIVAKIDDALAANNAATAIGQLIAAIAHPAAKLTVRVEVPAEITVEPVATPRTVATEDVGTTDTLTAAATPFRRWLADNIDAWPAVAAMLADVRDSLDGSTLLAALSRLGRHSDVLALSDALAAYDDTVGPAGLFATCKSCGVRGTENLPLVGGWGPMCPLCRSTTVNGEPTGPLYVARGALQDAALVELIDDLGPTTTRVTAMT